jgi:hypothetical protein
VEFCVANEIARPVFTYTKSKEGGGYRCTVTVNEPDIDNPRVTCLRDHKVHPTNHRLVILIQFKENAKEDACHDMFILLRSLPQGGDDYDE